MLKVPVYILASGPNGGQVHLVKTESFYTKSDTKLTCPEAIYDFARKHLYTNTPAEEIVYMIGINSKCIPLGCSEVSHGCVNSAMVGVREIMIRAFLMGASEFILLHNHVSGSAEPSFEDIHLTWNIYELSNRIGLPLAEHLIVGEGEYAPLIAGNRMTRIHNLESITSDLYFFLKNSYMFFDVESVLQNPQEGIIKMQFPDGKWSIEIMPLPQETII